MREPQQQDGVNRERESEAQAAGEAAGPGHDAPEAAQHDEASEDVQVDEPGDDEHSGSPMGELDDDGPDASPEVAIADSLRNALQAIRADADEIERLPTGEQRVEAAELLAEHAGALDEQIGSIARADGEHD